MHEKKSPIPREHVRAVVWPREPVEGPQGRIYRYAVVGLVVSDRPIEAFHNPDGSIRNEVVLDGDAPGITEALAAVRQVEPTRKIGDAVDALCSLDAIVDGGA